MTPERKIISWLRNELAETEERARTLQAALALVEQRTLDRAPLEPTPEIEAKLDRILRSKGLLRRSA